MSTPQNKTPLQGITLEMILTRLVEQYGWYRLGKKDYYQLFYQDSQYQIEPQVSPQDPVGQRKSGETLPGNQIFRKSD